MFIKINFCWNIYNIINIIILVMIVLHQDIHWILLLFMNNLSVLYLSWWLDRMMNNWSIIWSDFLVLNSNRRRRSILHNLMLWLSIQNINMNSISIIMNIIAVLDSLYSKFRLLKMRLMRK